jgi:lysozyme
MTNWPDNDIVIPKALSFIKVYEGFREKAYLDSAGIPTIGYGSTEYENGIRVTLEDPTITEEVATELLQHNLLSKIDVIKDKFLVPISINQAVAVCSLVYNIGVEAFHHSSVLKYINQNNIPKAADSFLLWDKITVHGKFTTSLGLFTRRSKERRIFLGEG